LLALMLVVAMIPLSAAAAEGDPTIYVDNNLAKLNGTEYSVTAESTTVDISAVLDANVTMVVKGAKSEITVPTTDTDLTVEATKSGDVYTLNLETQVAQGDNDAPQAKAYTLKITVKDVPASSDTGIKALVNDSANNYLKDMVDYTISGNKITIWTAFGKAQPANLSADNFILSSDKAEVTSASASSVVVAAEDGTSVTYSVELKTADGFTSFTVPNQVGDSVIKAEGTATNTVAINVPYETDFDKKIVPTFTVDDAIIAVTIKDTAYNQNVIESGKTEIKFTKGSAVSFYLWTSESDSTEVKVTLTAPAQNPEAVLKTVQVGGSNVVEVTGNVVNVEMPANTNFATAAAVKVTASADATVSVPAQNKTASGDTISDVAISGKTFVVRVVSQDGKTTNDYTINLTAAAAPEAKLNSFAVKVTENGKETVYTASNNTLTLPYAAKAALGDYKVFVQASTGAAVTYGSNSAVTNGTTTLTDLIADDKITLKVTASDGTVVTNTIAVKYENAKTARSISSATFVGTNDEAKITADNTYSATVGTAKLNGSTVKTIKVTVPYSFDATSAKAYLSALGLSEGATAYLVDSSADAVALVGETTPTEFSFNGKLDAVSSDGVLTDSKALKICVISEKTKVDETAIDKNWFDNNSDKYTAYYVYAEKAAAQEGASLTSVKSAEDANVKASLSGKTITITVPHTYAASNEFALEFTTSKLATLAANEDGSTVLDTKNNKFHVESGELHLDSQKLTTDKAGTVYVISESGKNKTPYNVKLVVADAEKGATLTGVKVNNTAASINGKEITVNLPFGTNLYPVKLTLTASKMAKILVNGVAYDANNNYDLNKAITIKVTSEDEATTNVYTLKANVSAQFTDVNPGDWYYDNVMRAVELGILSGKGNGTFAPSESITRRDFAIMLAQALGHSNSEPASSPFVDVADDDYGVSSIAYLYEKNIAAGDNEGKFNPNAKITRQEAATLLAKAFGATGTSSELYNDDAAIASWAKSFVYACKEAGLMKGDAGTGNFRPTSTITRAEAASAMVNAVDK
ncbi:MAG: S-layer homology domain-containing protein, partial [Acutalibacter sp.]